MSAVAAHVEFSGDVFVSAAVTPGGEGAALQVIYAKRLVNMLEKRIFVF